MLSNVGDRRYYSLSVSISNMIFLAFLPKDMTKHEQIGIFSAEDLGDSGINDKTAIIFPLLPA